MNSEELEASLKAEFESQLTDLFADVRQKTTDFQRTFETEFEKHKTQMDEAIKLLSERFEKTPALDPAVGQSITEHLRLAKDAGAELAATAFDEAEKLRAETPTASNYDRLRDAINEITSKTSQSTILTSLVTFAAEFAPRGVFFIVKNDQFVGWKRFGQDHHSTDAVSDVRFPVGEETVLAKAIRTLNTANSSYVDNGAESEFVNALGLGRPDRMHAIPLTARGRGVAVMYVDYGISGTELNIEALESLVRVAGLTVELLAASQSAPSSPPEASALASQVVPNTEQISTETVQPLGSYIAVESTTEPVNPEASDPYSAHYIDNRTPQVRTDNYSHSYIGEPTGQIDAQEAVQEFVDNSPNFAAAETEYEPTFAEAAPAPVYEVSQPEQTVSSIASEDVTEAEAEAVTDFTFSEQSLEESEEVTYFEPEVIDEVSVETVTEPESSAPASITDFAFSSGNEFDASANVTEAAIPEVSYATTDSSAGGYQAETFAAPIADIAPAKPTRSRYSERNMDLPIDVPEDERRFHNNARRFARLLVSEIKLYNEQKVNEGRESRDLYDRLREAIDRSRDMYDKRIEPSVASKFDYFDYELVNDLAEGDQAKLGANYKTVAV